MSRFIGATFLILGTCIGGSMLALPISTAQEGLVRTLVIMLGAWTLMTIGAFALLRVNLKLPENSNLITMAQATLGKIGAFFTWGITLTLLYTLLSAYISSGQDLLSAIFSQMHIPSPMWFNAVLFTVGLGLIVFRGIHLVDYVNRGLMGTKLLVCLVLILLLIPFAHINNLSFKHLGGNSSAMTCMTAFGYACIIPSIRTYLHSDSKKLHWAVILGGLIPLILYIAWIVVVQATIPTTHSLVSMNAADHPLKAMIESLASHVNNTGINTLTQVFTTICVFTSFLGVALSLSDFLSDGIKINKEKTGAAASIVGLTLIPPLMIVLAFPAIFLKAFSYAGILCVILLFLVPVLMAFSLLIQKAKKKKGRVPSPLTEG
jgi:tyrosine-specific transport protein